jgi:hypothetical protein
MYVQNGSPVVRIISRVKEGGYIVYFPDKAAAEKAEKARVPPSRARPCPLCAPRVPDMPLVCFWS